MQRCKSCGSDLPINAQFCGNCGRPVNGSTQGATGFTNSPATDIPTPNTPPLFSSPSYPNIPSTQMGREDDTTLPTSWFDADTVSMNPHFPERRTDENEAVLPDILLPGMLAMQGRMPSASQPPMVQGTPQVGGVPSVQGTPSLPPSSPTSRPGFAHGAAPSAPSHAPTWEQPQPSHYQPVHHPQPIPPPHGPEHHHHHHSGPLHTRAPHVPRPHGSTAAVTSKVAAGVASKWLIVVLAAVVVAATSGVVFVLASQPTLLLTGNGSVAAGGVLHLHGKGFLPGGSITLTLDNSLPVSFGGQPIPQGASHVGERNANIADSALMPGTGQFEEQSTPKTSIAISPAGTFDIDVMAPASWSSGVHTLHASESFGSRSASLHFTVLSQPAKLVVNPSSLDFGSLQIGSKAALSVTVGNAGQARLSWSASIDPGGTKWLALQGSGTGAIAYKGSEEIINLVADATNLKVGLYTTALVIHSDGAKAQIPVSLNVVPKNGKKQAQLNVASQSLDFGQVPANQQAFQSISVANLGQLPLLWQASTDATSASWLALSKSNGTVQPGTIPQTIMVLVNTTALAKGSYSGTITVTSNGGNAQVPVTLTVLPPNGRPTPPILTGGPSGFNVPGDPNCTYNASAGWTCTATLSSFATAQGNLNWSASSSGVSGVIFTPQSGTLLPGQTKPVSISIPNTICPANATFTFTGPGNQVLMPWTCGALTLTASKTSLNANTDCTFSNGWTCNETLGIGPNNQGQVSWSASSSGINGISFNPPNGVLTAGQSVPITITVPNTACPASANLTFSAQGTVPITVPWSCGTPTLAVSPTSFNIPTNICSYVAGQGWSCTATVSLGSKGDPSVNWSVSGGITGTTFSPPGGTVSAGSPVTVTITVPDAVCPTQANIVFSGRGANPMTVPWSCAAPTLTAAATPSNCPQNSDGSYTCTDTVYESASSQGSLIWSASASSNLPGVTFNPPNGTLGPNGSTRVTISLPANDCTNGSFNYSEQGTSNTATVTWICTPLPPTLTINPTGFASYGSNPCPYDSASNTFTCTAVLGETSNSQGNVTWAATSDLSGVVFTPPKGTLNPGGSIQVNISGIPCGVGTFTFSGSGGATPVSASWSCGSALSVW